MVSGYANRWNGVAFPAQAERRMAAAHLMPGPVGEVFSSRSGRRVNGKGLAVTVDSTGAGTYTVTAGSGVIYDSTYATQGAYEFEIDAGVTAVAFPARPASGTSRIDLIVAQLTDSDIPIGATKDVVITRVAGTAGATPSAPALPAASLLLATVTVPNSGAITVVSSTAVVTAAGGILPVATTAERDALVTANIAYRGLLVDNAQTGYLERYTGTVWEPIQARARVGSWSGSAANGTTTRAVTFTPAFPTGVTPIVAIAAVDVNMDWVTVSAGSVTNVGMNILVRNGFGTALAATANYIAIAP